MPSSICRSTQAMSLSSSVMSVAPPNMPKEKKRRNSEKRKLKSRNAARTRREKETSIFYEVAHELPMPHNMCAQLDKAGIMRLLLSYLRIRKILPTAIKSELMHIDEDIPLTTEQLIDSYYLKALDGFALMLSEDGDVIFISDNVSQYMGLKQIDLMGQSIYDFSHPCDHEEIKEHLSDHPWLMSQLNGCKTSKRIPEERHSFLMRMKCPLTSKGKIVTLKTAAYKVVSCNGILKVAPSFVTPSGYRLPQFSCLSLIAMPIHHPANIEIPMDKQTFLTRHSMDMKFTYCDSRIKQLLGYDAEDLVDQSFYNFYHASDSQVIDKFHKNLFAKGQATSGCYRFLAKKSGYAWMETQATVIYNNKTNKPQCVVCVNYMISGLEEEEAVISSQQLDEAMQMSTEKTFMPKPDNIIDDEFPLYLTGSNSDVVNPNELAYLAPTAGDTVVFLNCSSPPCSITDTEPMDQPMEEEGFAPFLPFEDLNYGTTTTSEAQEQQIGGELEFSPKKMTTPNLILPDTDSVMSSSKDPLMGDCSSEAFDQLQVDEMSMRAPYISMSDDFDFCGDKMIDMQQFETWEPVDLFRTGMTNTSYLDSRMSPAVRAQKQKSPSLSSGSLTAPATPYSNYTPVCSPQPPPANNLWRSMPNLMVDSSATSISTIAMQQQQQPQHQTYWDPNQSLPPLLSPPVHRPVANSPNRQMTKYADFSFMNFDPGKQPPPSTVQQALKRKIEMQQEQQGKIKERCKVARLERGSTEGGGGTYGTRRQDGIYRGSWNATKSGLALDSLQPPGGGTGMNMLQSMLFRSDGRSINNQFGHSALLQKVAQEVHVCNKQASKASTASSQTSGDVVPFPLFQAQPSPPTDSDNGIFNYLSLITRHDLDVNTPLQSSAGLLQGEELLRALDIQ